MLTGGQAERVLVRTDDADALAAALAGDGVEIRREAADELTVRGLPARRIAETAFSRGILVTGLIPQAQFLIGHPICSFAASRILK